MHARDLHTLVRSVLLEVKLQSYPTEVRPLLGRDVYPDMFLMRSDQKVLVPNLEIVNGTHPEMGKLSKGVVQKHRSGYSALRDAGMSDYEIRVASKVLHTTPLDIYFRYDISFNSKGQNFKVPPDVMKAISIRESTLKEDEGESGYDSGKVVHFTKNLLGDMQLRHPDLFGMYKESDLKDPNKSLNMAAKRMHVLLYREKKPMREALIEYGPGRRDYADEVEAFRKFVEATQISPVGAP